MNSLVSTLLRRLDDKSLIGTGVIPWSSPVLSFGDLSTARVATLGLNPSNREFVDGDGKELDGASRRFHTLTSLGLSAWSDAKPRHLSLIAESCRDYFATNPYDTWFKRLDRVIAGLKVSLARVTLTLFLTRRLRNGRTSRGSSDFGSWTAPATRSHCFSGTHRFRCWF